MPSPKLLVIAGPNGSGKSTLYRKLLPKYRSLAKLPFVNPDDIAKEMFGDFLLDDSVDNNRKMLAAGKEAVIRRKEYLKARLSFGFETTLSGSGEKRVIREALADGYELYIIYVALEDPFLNIQRVRTRVKNHGHYVDPTVILRRYHKSLTNVQEIMLEAKGVYLFDNTEAHFKLLATLRTSGARGDQSIIVRSPLRPWSFPLVDVLVSHAKTMPPGANDGNTPIETNFLS